MSAINAVWKVVVLHCERMDLWNRKRISPQQQCCQYYHSDALSIAGIRNRNFEDKQLSEVVVLQLSEFLAGSPLGGGGVQALFVDEQSFVPVM